MENNDMTLINPEGREVVVPNELGQELLLVGGYKVAGEDEAPAIDVPAAAAVEAPAEAPAPEAAPAADDAPKKRGA